VDADNIKKLAELRMEYDNLIDTIRTALIPAFFQVVEFIQKYFGKISDVTESDRTKIEIARHQPNWKAET